MSIFQDDEFIRVRDLQRIDIKPGEMLVARLGVEGMKKDQIEQYVNNIAVHLKNNLPGIKIMITTVTSQNPFDLYAIKLPNEEEDTE